MYTECPDCNTVFRVTARMLQQASGHVRCGECGRAFNALERLSEDPPHAGKISSADSGGTDEQEKAFLDTLDELSGTDNIRIEDTGVEWRVHDDDADMESIEADESGSDSAVELADTGSVRWYIEDSQSESRDAGHGAVIPGAGDEAPEASSEAAEFDSIDWNTQASLDLPKSAGRPDEERYDDNTPLPDYLEDDEDLPAPPDLPRRREDDRIEPRSAEFDERQVDFALSDPDDWTELLDEVGGGREAAPPRVTDASLEDTDIRGPSDEGDDGDAGLPSDIDTQFDLQALEMGLDLTGAEPIVVDAVADEVDEQELVTDGASESRWAGVSDDDDGELAQVADDEQDEPRRLEENLALEESEDDTAHADAAEAAGAGKAYDRESTGEFERRIALAADALNGKDEESDIGNGDVRSAPAIAEPAKPGGPDKPEHYVPPQTEEEMTINMLIDQDLLRLAEKEDVFRSTTADARKTQDDVRHVETIIMEGEFVRHALDTGQPPLEIDADSSIEQPVPLKDTYMSKQDRIRGGRRRMDPPSFTIVAGVAVLALVFAAQVVHAYRETLATYEAFDHTVGSVYRLFGAPITPHWDIKGWQFEATSGSTAAYDEVLTISSRIANRSDGPLPYPLLHVSLTDRWEEITGSRVLEPDEYLAGNADPRGSVAPGKKFTAIVTIAALSPEATGFKLNVCYRVSRETVRCATGAFKH